MEKTSSGRPRVAASLLGLLLAACGGGNNESAFNSRSASTDTVAVPSLIWEQVQIANGAQLNSASLDAAEQQAQAAESANTTGEISATLADLPIGQIAPNSAYLSGEIARKAAAVRIPTYRFYNGSTGAHFFTTSETERANVAANLSPPYNFEGAAFSVASAFSPGLSPVHRFYNTRSGVHFYTISETERANVVATLPFYNYEGVAYHASQVAGAGLIPFYRFYVPSKGFHFYTASETERANIQATLSAVYKFEGVGYYVLSSEWRAEKLPHTGITASQCFAAGSNTLVTCSSASANNLNPRQDGHRTTINPMSYSEVAKAGGGVFDRTECVKDNVTGLIWEGKEDSGMRFGGNFYTNLGDNSPNDASVYIAWINATKLCGYNDWRLPTRSELYALVDFGTPINTAWFPNTATEKHWSSEGLSTDSGLAWNVYWGSVGASSDFTSRSAALSVRLVRGAASLGPRYSFSTVAYGNDGVNNVVNDAWTGLQWRRCEQGRIWSGSACSAHSNFIPANYFTHEEALAYAKAQIGWRLPNIKELASLVDLSVGSGARINPTAFPGADASVNLSSSPYVGPGSGVWSTDFSLGYVFVYPRENAYQVRWVRASQ